jgi:hypothetical protein
MSDKYDDKLYEFIILNLKVIAQTLKNKRLRMTTNGLLTIEDEGFLVPFKRRLYGDGREKLIRDVNMLMSEVHSHVKGLLASKHLHGEDTEEKRMVLNQIAGLHRELKRSLTGFKNLISTYEADELTVSKLELIMEKICSQMSEIKLKIPNVEKIIAPVYVDDDDLSLSGLIKED